LTHELKVTLTCSMRCLAKATLSLAERYEGAKAPLHWASRELRRLSELLADAAREIDVELDDPPSGGCRELLGDELHGAMREALSELSLGGRELDRLVEATRRLALGLLIHVMAYAKACSMLGLDGLAHELGGAARSLKAYVDSLRPAHGEAHPAS